MLPPGRWRFPARPLRSSMVAERSFPPWLLPLPASGSACASSSSIASTLRNPHTRRAYVRAVTAFLLWCEEAGVPSIAAVQPLHVAAWIEGQTRERSAPTVKQQLAAIHHLFDWLVMGQVVPANPAASVRGPSHVVRQGKTPVLDPTEARTLLDSIDVTTPMRLRDRPCRNQRAKSADLKSVQFQCTALPHRVATF